MRSIKVVGYDMDYTLVHYHVEDWERRAYQHIRRRLVKHGWPIGDLQFDSDLVARGLIIDTQLGNILKANRFGFVKTAYHGTTRMEYDELHHTYFRHPVDLSSSRYRFLNTLFALSEGCLFAQLVDRLDAGELSTPSRRDPSSGSEAMGYRDVYDRVRDNIDATHTEGELKAEIMANPSRFVDLDEQTVMALRDQKHAGKKLVLITNSEWTYTRAMMEYSVDRYLPKSMRWRDLFDLSIVAARKPAFFGDRAPVLKVIDDAGRLEPCVGALEDNGCYFGGSASDVEDHFGVAGDEILYMGDHMFGDVHASKRLFSWRTALILRELEGELAAVERGRDVLSSLSELMRDKEALEWEHCQARLALQRSKGGYADVAESTSSLNKKIHKLRAQITALDERIAPVARQAGTAHSSRWGLLMRAGNDKSQLARQIERYADVYTSRVSNLVYTTPFAYLRSPRGSLPHDPLVSRALVEP
jgi:5'-nucleotidase